MEWNTLLKAADKLSLDIDQLKVRRLKDISENGQYYLTFWGHFSAGKSRLINNLLRRDILPVQVRETTSVMTFIKHAEHEYANIFYEDGRKSTVELDDIKRIYQNSEEAQVEDIDYIEVFLDNPLLERGLVMVDTPGVNTIIAKHQDLAVSVIEVSRKIVYVMGGGLTRADEEFIRCIRESGVEMLFVRTKCDLLNPDEESPEDALQKEVRGLNAICGEVGIHFVSNLPEKKEFFNNLEPLLKDLQKISENLEEEFQRSFHEQMRIYAERFKILLTDRLEEMESLYRSERDYVEAKLREGEKKIQALEEIIKRQNSQFDSRISNLRTEVRRELPHLLHQLTESFKRKMEDISLTDEGVEIVEKIYLVEMEKAIGKLQRFFHLRFDEFILMEEQPLHEFLSKEESSLPEPLSYREMEQHNAMVLKQYTSKLEEMKKSLHQLQKEKEGTKENLNEMEVSFADCNYDEEIMQIEAHIRVIPNEIAMMVSEDQPTQPSDLLRKAGKAVDIALLMIPGTAIAAGMQGLVKTEKVAALLKNSGKAGELIKKVTYATEMISKVDNVRDRTYALKNAINQGKMMSDKKSARHIKELVLDKAGTAYDNYRISKRQEDEKQHGVLDMLEVAFWAEKLGKYFDKPQKREVDREAELQKAEYREELYQKKKAVLEEYNKKRREFNMTLSRQEELEKEEADTKRMLQEIEEETEKKADQLQRQAKEKVLEEYKKRYADYFDKNLKKLDEEMTERYFQALCENTVFHMAQLNEKINMDLEKEKGRLETILVERNDKEKITEDMNEIKGLIRSLA